MDKRWAGGRTGRLPSQKEAPMLRRGSNPIQKEEWNQKVTKAADSFWSAFQMTENGKVKSTLLM